MGNDESKQAIYITYYPPALKITSYDDGNLKKFEAAMSGTNLTDFDKIYEEVANSADEDLLETIDYINSLKTVDCIEPYKLAIIAAMQLKDYIEYDEECRKILEKAADFFDIYVRDRERDENDFHLNVDIFYFNAGKTDEVLGHSSVYALRPTSFFDGSDLYGDYEEDEIKTNLKEAIVKHETLLFSPNFPETTDFEFWWNIAHQKPDSSLSDLPEKCSGMYFTLTTHMRRIFKESGVPDERLSALAAKLDRTQEDAMHKAHCSFSNTKARAFAMAAVGGYGENDFYE